MSLFSSISFPSFSQKIKLSEAKAPTVSVESLDQLSDKSNELKEFLSCADQKELIANYSWLQKDEFKLPPENITSLQQADFDTFNELIADLSTSLENESTPYKLKLKERLKAFKEGVDRSTTLFTALMDPTTGINASEEALDKWAHTLSENHAKDKVTWIPLSTDSHFNQPSTLYCRIDDKTITFICGTYQALASGMHESCVKMEKDLINGPVDDATLVKTIIRFEHETGETLKDKDFFKVLLRGLANDKINPLEFQKYYFESIPLYCSLKRLDMHDSKKHPERYLPLPEENLTAALYYSLIGYVEGEANCTKEIQEWSEVAAFRILNKKWKEAIKHAYHSKNISGLTSARKMGSQILKLAYGLYQRGLVAKEDLNVLIATSDDLDGIIKPSKPPLFSANKEKNINLDCKENNTDAVQSLSIHLTSKTNSATTSATSYANAKIHFDPSTKKSQAYLEAQDAIATLNAIPLNFTAETILPSTGTGVLEQLANQLTYIKNIQGATCSLKNVSNSPLFTKYVKINFDSHQKEAIKHYLNQLFENFPIPSHEPTSFWQTIPSDQIDTCLEQLDRLGNSLFEAASLEQDFLKKEPVMSSLHYAIMAASDQLARRKDDSKLANFKTFSAEFFMALTHPLNTVETVQSEQQLKSLALYFDPAWNVEAFLTSKQQTFQDYIHVIQSSAMAILSVGKNYTLYGPEYSVIPLNWCVDHAASINGPLDAQSATYKFYQQFLPLESVQKKWDELGTEAPSTEAGKVQWLVMDAINGGNCLPKSVSHLQKALIRCIGHYHDLSNLGSQLDNATPKASLEKEGGMFWSNRIKVSYKDLPELVEQKTINKQIIRKIVSDYLAEYSGFKTKYQKDSILTPSFGKNGAHKYEYSEQVSGLFSNRDWHAFDLLKNPYDIPNRIIRYFQSNDINNMDLNWLLNKGLLMFGRLEMQLKSQPEFSNIVAQFFKESIYHVVISGEQKKLGLLPALVDSGDKVLKKMAEIAAVDGSQITETVTMSDLLLKQLLPTAKNLEERFCYSYALASVYFNEYVAAPSLATKLKLAEIAVFLVTAQNQLKVNYAPTSPHILATLKCFKLIALEVINANPEYAKQVMQSALEQSGKKVSAIDNVTVDGMKLLSGDYLLDLEQGVLCYKNTPLLSSLPTHLYDVKYFKEAYGIDLPKILPADYAKIYDILFDKANNAYRLIPKDPLSSNTEIVLTLDKRLSRIKNGKEETLIPLKDLKNLKKSFPGVFGEKVFSFWLQGQNQESKKFLDVQDAQKIIARSVGGAIIEIDCKTVLTAEGESVHYAAKIKSDGLYLQSPQSVSKELREFMLRLADSGNDLEFWSDGNGKIEKIKIPSKDRSFTVKDGKIFCDWMHGFYCDFKIQKILGNHACISMENEEGSKKCVAKVENALADFAIIDEKLVPENRLSQFILLKSLVEQGSFEEAAESIKSITTLVELTKEEKDLLKAASSRLNKATDGLPLKIKLDLFLYEHEGLGKKESLIDLFHNYCQFKKIKVFFGGEGLARQEERHLLEHFMFYIEQQSRRSIIQKLKEGDLFSTEDLLLISNRQLIEDRLNLLKGASKGLVGLLPNRISNPIPLMGTFYKFAYDKFIEHYDLTQKPGSAPHLLKLKEELKNFDRTKAPAKQLLQDHFYLYYEILLSATEQERKDFAQSLKLVPRGDIQINTLVSILMGVCNHPAGKTSLGTIKERIDEYRKTLSEYTKGNSLFSTCKQGSKLALSFGRLCYAFWGMGRFHLATAAAGYISLIAQECFANFRTYWNTTLKQVPITALVTPWSNTVQPTGGKYYSFKERDDQNEKVSKLHFDQSFCWRKPISNPVKKFVNPLVKDESTVQGKRTARTHKDLEDYLTAQPETLNYYGLKAGADLPGLIKGYRKLALQEAAGLKAEGLMLLERANSPTKGDISLSVKKSVQHEPISMEELFSLFADSTEEEFKQRLALSDEDFTQLLKLLTDHYVKVSLNQKNLRFISELEKAEKQADKQPVEGIMKEYDLHIHEAVKILRTRRAYHPTTALDDRKRLAFEVSHGILHRDDQIAMMKKVDQALKTHRDVVINAPFGWGKSKNFRAMLNALYGFGFNIVPSAQEIPLAEQLEQQMKLVCGKKVSRLDVSRETEFTVEKLNLILNRIKESSVKGNDASNYSIRPETLLAMQLHYLLCAERFDQGVYQYGTEDEIKVKLFLSIFREIKVKWPGYIEELTEVLNPNLRLLFALDEVKNYHSRYAKEINKIISFLLENKKLRELFQLKQNGQSNLKAEDFEKAVIPEIVNHYVTTTNLSKSEQDKLKQFLLCPKDPVQFKEAYEWCEKQPDRDLYALIKGSLHVLLPTSCENKVNSVNGYGLSKKFPAFKFVIPYWKKDTPKETDQGPSVYTPDITLLRSYYYYLHMGLSDTNVEELVDQLRAQAIVEAKGKSIAETPSAKEFARLVAYTGLDPNVVVLDVKDKMDMELIAKEFSRNEKIICHFVEHLVGPQIEIYEQTFEGSMQNLREMLKQTVSFSATPHDPAAVGLHAKMLSVENTSGEIAYMLLTKTGAPEKVRLSLFESGDPKQAFEEVAAKSVADGQGNSPCSGIVEVSPVFTQVGNLESAKILAEHLKGKPQSKDIKGILFYDQNTKKYQVLNLQSGAMQPLYGSTYKEEDLFKFCSESEAFNTDWKSSISAYFQLVLSSKSTFEDAGQAGGRLRLARFADMLQHLGLVISKEVHKKYFNEKKDIPPHQMLNFLLENSTIKEATTNFLSLKDQMENEPRSFLFERMEGLSLDKNEWENDLKKDIDVRAAVSIYSKNKKVFMNTNAYDPWKAYAKLKLGCKTNEQLSAFNESCKNTAANLKGVGWGAGSYLKNKLQGYSKNWDQSSALLLMPEVSGFGSAADCHVEVIRETHKIRVINTEKKLNSFGNKYLSDDYPKNFNIYKNEWWKPAPIAHTIDKVFAVVKKFVWNCEQRFSNTLDKVGGGTLLSAYAVVVITLSAPVPILNYLGTALGISLTVGAAFGYLSACLGIALVATATVGRFITQNFVRFAYPTVVTHYAYDVASTDLREKTRKAASMFGYEYIVTNNKSRMWAFNGMEGNSVFAENKKPLLQILVIVEKQADGKKKITFVDGNANDFSHYWLALDQNEPDMKYQMGIYDVYAEDDKTFETRFVKTGKNGIDTEWLKKETAFHAGILQAKLLNGHLKYTKDQLDVVPLVVSKIGANTVNKGEIAEDFFVGDALKTKQRSLYPTLPLSKVLNDKKGNVQVG